MRGIKWFGLSLILMSVTACAPVVYDSTYRSPATHVSVLATRSQPAHRYQQGHHQRSIEVMLYADNTYLGVYFAPMRLVIVDGQYVEIPARDRRGRQTKIYAHYVENNLHFDSDRHCRNIQDSSRYSYDNSWDKGRNYSHIKAGKEHDLTGLRLQIRNLPDERSGQKAKAADNRVKTSSERRKQVVKTQSKRSVTVTNNTIKQNVAVVHEEKKSFEPRVERQNNGREAKKVVVNRASSRAVKVDARPEIIKKITKSVSLQASANKKRVAGTEIPAEVVLENEPTRRQGHKLENNNQRKADKTPNAKSRRDAKQSANKYSQDNEEEFSDSKMVRGKSNRQLKRKD